MAKKKQIDRETRRWLKGDDNFGILTYGVVDLRRKAAVKVLQINAKEKTISLDVLDWNDYTHLVGGVVSQSSPLEQITTTSSVVTANVGLMFFNFVIEFRLNKKYVFQDSLLLCHFDSLKMVDVPDKQDKIRRHMLDEL